jgi:predicted lysophospholipase L1 biosynthesis ABC-type transport system permease subunit
VAGDERSDGAHEPAPFTIYWPLLIEKFWDLEMAAQHSASFVVRSDRTGTAGFFKEIQNAVWAVNSSLPTGTMRTLADVQRRSMMRTSFTLLMLGVAAGIALLLGVVGLYGVISYAVSQRTREIGIRMALGAQPSDVSRLFLLRGAALTAVGVVLGIATSAGVSRLLGSLLYGVSPVDPLTYAGVSAGLLGAALLACYLPARSASRVDPIQALRSE